jgi:pectate lyase
MKKVNAKLRRGGMIFLLLVFCLGQVFAADCGDVNSDGNINIVDALLIAQHYVDMNPQDFNEGAADVNGDSIISIVDALLVARYYVKLIDELTGCQIPGDNPDGLVGFATVNDWGQDGTTGGAGGPEVTPATAQEFINYIKQDGPLIIKVAGEIVLPEDPGMYEVQSDKSIIGVGSNARITGGGLELGAHLWDQRNDLKSPPDNAAHNIIIRNIWFDYSYCDNISIMIFSHHVWVDHCRFSNAPERIPEVIDGRGVDIKRGANYVTVSYCIWDSTVPEGGIVGVTGSGIEEQELGRQKVTFHHNWWNGPEQPTPQIHHGQVHYFNNLWTDIPDYGIGVGRLSHVVSENGVFDGGGTYLDELSSSGALKDTGTIGGASLNPDDVTLNPGAHYEYTLDPVDSVMADVMANAGPGKIDL